MADVAGVREEVEYRRGYRNGGGVPTAVSSGKRPGNIYQAYYNSTQNFFLALGCRVYAGDRGEGPKFVPSTHNRVSGAGYRNGGQTDEFAVFCAEMARNIDTVGHISQVFLQRATGLRVYHFFWAVLSNLSASHRVSKVTYSTPDPGQPWGRGCRGGTGGGSRGGTLDI